jgi:hypothetical protein
MYEEGVKSLKSCERTNRERRDASAGKGVILLLSLSPPLLSSPPPPHHVMWYLQII